MSNTGKSARWTAALALGVVMLTALVPAAEAGHGRGHGEWRYKGYYASPVARECGVRRVYRPERVVEIRSSSCGVPALASFIGGLAVGAVIASHSQPVYEAPHYAAPPEPEYYYYDPYCGERFSSLDSYGSHVCGHHHPRIVQVISVDTGRCVHVYHYYRGRWEDQDGDWDEDDE
ncbi:MAG: hypothetical protein E6K73_04930 [Candidatus Eisenbacteria bacterium]|uniref:C2H2-type domain-containing protein n=1 Tax=Eiseniibacteriota bacterium TaxID=2212470 RepID=A0A538SK59_UNCEI|nr:MAG: hypothetical protein E6K73_04930 [Candidatus Eisenbacteria bacterium]